MRRQASAGGATLRAVRAVPADAALTQTSASHWIDVSRSCRNASPQSAAIAGSTRAGPIQFSVLTSTPPQGLTPLFLPRYF